MKRRRPTLAAVLLSSSVLVILLVGALFVVIFAASRRSIAAASTQLRQAAAARVGARIRDELGAARRVLDDVERHVRLGIVSPADTGALERAFVGAVSDYADLEEVTLTEATLERDANGDPVVADEGRWQLSVSRVNAEATSPIRTRYVTAKGRDYFAEVRERGASDAFDDARPEPRRPAKDPTANATFSTTVSRGFYGQVIWSDLHFTQNDEDLPLEQRRVVVTVLKAIEDHAGRFVGVVRVGIFPHVLDAIGRLGVDESDPDDPHRIFVCDGEGRLVTRLAPDDPTAVVGDDVRVMPRHIPKEIDVALHSPLLAAWNDPDVRAASPDARSLPAMRFDVDGRAYLATFVHLDDMDWNVGIVVPEDFYAKDLRSLQQVFIVAYAIVAALIVLGTLLALRALRRGLGEIVGSSSRIRQLDFRATDSQIAFRDVQDVMDSLERAKTVMRALEKYVPVDLVRQLFQANRDPVLGGELATISLMFTDIEGFTSLSEVLPANELAAALGQYLETMTGAIGRTGGTIDKFIGDAVMAIWNAPVPCENHAKKACEAALACVEATTKLFASPAWGGKKALHTRFGLHKGEVLVGHFGAPTRMSFTALGDGVNLAARLEGLCKQYGITIMASEAIEAESRAAFVFRALDVVAVKGKKKGVKVFELLGRAGEPIAALAAARGYEEALAAYLARDFSRARELFARHPGDPPSRVLAERCRALEAAPPPPEWDGVYVASSK